MLRLVVVVVLLMVGALAGPPAAAQTHSGDLAVDVAVVDDVADPQVVRARLTNLGPDDASHAILRVAVDGGGVITAHTGDPQPGSLADGVGCSADSAALACSYEIVPSNTSVSIDVAVDVGRGTTVRATAQAAGTPDPNPTANNADEVALRPAEADLAVTDVAVVAPDGADDLAPAALPVVEVHATVVHRAGREVAVELVVDGAERVVTDGCLADGPTTWRCPLGRAAPGTQRAVVVGLERPEPGEPDRAVTLTAVAEGLVDPDPEAASATIDLAARTPVPGDLVRHAGDERIATAIAISQTRFGSGDADAVVLARADTAADALAGGPLAADLRAPILLTAPAALPRTTLTEIDRVLGRGGRVHLLGGTAAIADAVAEQLTDAGYDTTRVMGSNRYATAVAIYEALGRPATVAVADGDGHADAVVAGAAMAMADGALLLTAGDRLPAEVAPLRARVDWAVGRAAADAVPGASALSGRTAAATSVAVAQAFTTAPDAVGLATADAFPDALAGGPLAAALGAPLLLTDGDRLSGEVADYLAETTTIVEAHLLGGPAALSADVEEAVAALIAR